MGSLGIYGLNSILTQSVGGRDDLGELIMGAVDCRVHALLLARSDSLASLL